MNIHENLRTLREGRSLSQQRVARVLGMTRQTYMRIESGLRDITLTELQKLAGLYEIPLVRLISGESGPAYSVEVETVTRVEEQAPVYRIHVPQQRAGRFREVILYTLEKLGARPHVGLTVIYKLLYFIDFDYYEKYEEQLMGARYIKNQYGPIPAAFQEIAGAMIENGELEEVKSTYFRYDQRKYLPHRKADLTRLSAREIKHIDEVLERLGHKNATELSHYSHQDVPWITARDGEELEYEAVFYRTRETSVRAYGD